jgi:hypothetical protein
VVLSKRSSPACAQQDGEGLEAQESGQAVSPRQASLLPSDWPDVGGALPRKKRNARFEELFEFQCGAYKLPEPHQQYYFAESMGRKFRSDFAWPAYKLLVEIEGGIWRAGGGAHSHPIDIERDIERRQHAVLLGFFMLPVITDQVKKGEAIIIVQRVLASRGWKPTP